MHIATRVSQLQHAHRYVLHVLQLAGGGACMQAKTNAARCHNTIKTTTGLCLSQESLPAVVLLLLPVRRAAHGAMALHLLAHASLPWGSLHLLPAL